MATPEKQCLEGQKKKYLLYFKILKTTGVHTCSQLSSIRLNSEEFSRVPGSGNQVGIGFWAFLGEWAGAESKPLEPGSEEFFGDWVPNLWALGSGNQVCFRWRNLKSGCGGEGSSNPLVGPGNRELGTAQH